MKKNSLVKFIFYMIVGLLLWVVLPILHVTWFTKLSAEVYLTIIVAEIMIAYFWRLRKGLQRHRNEMKKLKQDHANVEKLEVPKTDEEE